jgi:3',5'-nucleoside bisphosphate phosphatase
MKKIFRADLHVHTCLSPCGDLKMSPKTIVAQALKHNIDLIAISDHNSAENIPAVLRAAKSMPLIVLPGMEICTKEEVHVVALFDTVESAFELQKHVYEHLEGRNNERVFGMQVVANENDEVLRFNSKLLIGAADLSIEQLILIIHQLNGLAIASHIDRESYSIIGQLGFIPDSVHFDALEICTRTTIAEARIRFPEHSQFPIVQNSDAHLIDDLGNNFTKFFFGKSIVSRNCQSFKE